MVDTASGREGLEETLGRISRKSGVKATVVLDRATGAVLKATGKLPQVGPGKTDAGSSSAHLKGPFASESRGSEQEGDSSAAGARAFAAMIWSYVMTTGSLVQELDGEDELKLLRLRTKKQEFVIVPDPKYILVVIHDTPLA